MKTMEIVVGIALLIIVLIILSMTVFPKMFTIVKTIFSSFPGGSCSVDVSYCKLSVMHSPSLTSAEIEKILKDADSPAIKDEPNIANFFYTESLRTGIDDAIALAFFERESTYGKYGKASETKSIGNIKYTGICKTRYSGTKHKGFCKYPTWKKGVEHWYNLIKEVYVNEGRATVGDIIVKYAPCTENDVQEYVASVRNFVEIVGRDVSSCPLA